jgi:hypothetical protein
MARMRHSPQRNRDAPLGGALLFAGRYCQRVECGEIDGLSHPWFWTDGFDPIGEGRDTSPEVFPYMLLPDPTRRDCAAGRDFDCLSENAFREENALGMVPECAVPKVGNDLLGFIEPFVNAKVVLDGAAELLDAG